MIKKPALWIGLGILGLGALWALKDGGTIAPVAQAGEAGGTVSGKVTWDGAVPEPAKLEVNKDNDKCECNPAGGTSKFKLDESLVVDSASKGVANCVVFLKGATGGPVLTATIDQKGCQFVPHVALITKGQTAKILNPDGIAHNYHWWSTANPADNKTIAKFKKDLVVGPFEKAEFIRTTCDIHAWMGGWIVVADNGYATVTDACGSFKIEGIPAGKYTVSLWHEPTSKEGKALTQEKEITVEVGKGADAAFTLK